MQVALPRSLSHIRAGSVFEDIPGHKTSNFSSSDDTARETSFCDYDDDEADDDDIEKGSQDVHSAIEARASQKETLTAVADLVKMHMEKQLDDQTTRLLFAASRGDTGTISLMCQQGFSPDNADYDNRTALMIAAMRGNVAVAQLLLRYKVRENE